MYVKKPTNQIQESICVFHKYTTLATMPILASEVLLCENKKSGNKMLHLRYLPESLEISFHLSIHQKILKFMRDFLRNDTMACRLCACIKQVCMFNVVIFTVNVVITVTDAQNAVIKTRLCKRLRLEFNKKAFQ